jgi:hypothetical protein
MISSVPTVLPEPLSGSFQNLDSFRHCLEADPITSDDYDFV